MIEVHSTPTSSDIVQASQLLIKTFKSSLTAMVGMPYVRSLLQQVSESTDSRLLIARDNSNLVGYLVVFDDVSAMQEIALRAFQGLSVVEKLQLCLVVVAHPRLVLDQARTSQHLRKFAGFRFLSSWAVVADTGTATAAKLLRAALEQPIERRDCGVVVQIAVDKPKLIKVYSNLGFTTQVASSKFSFLVRNAPNLLP